MARYLTTSVPGGRPTTARDSHHGALSILADRAVTPNAGTLRARRTRHATGTISG
jgi:hypothetical protein